MSLESYGTNAYLSVIVTPEITAGQGKSTQMGIEDLYRELVRILTTQEKIQEHARVRVKGMFIREIIMLHRECGPLSEAENERD